MNASPVLTELVVVREWLQETAPQPSNPEAVTGYWRFTKHSIMQVLRTEGVSAAGGRDGLVRHMDPDAPLREERKSLAADDAVSRVPWCHCTTMTTPPSIRVMKKASRRHCTLTFEQGGSTKQLIYAEWRISRGEQPASAGHCFSNAKLFVRALAFFFFQRSVGELTQLAANENIDSAFDEGQDKGAWVGNPHRKLWKSTCTNAALNVTCSPPLHSDVS
jgi:nuclear pore complex protein Nup107